MRRNAFSLLELSIVLTILSVVLAGVLPYITEVTKSASAEHTKERLQRIEEALISYYIVNGFIPCPASPSAGLTAAAFGVANCAGTDVATGGVARIGAVPSKELGITDEDAFDGWGRRFIYAVDVNATVGTSFATSGALRVNDGGGTAMTTAAAYVLISTGVNGHGGFTRAGTRMAAGSTNADERNNCAPCDAVAADAIFVKKSPTTGTTAAATYDDVVRYKPRALIQNALGGASGLWAAYGQHIANTNSSGNVGVATTSPGYKLDVAGTIASSSVSGLELTNPNGQVNLWGEAPVARKWMMGPSGAVADDDFIIYDRESNQNRFLIDETTGNVGIGTTAPAPASVKLHVAGGGIRSDYDSTNYDVWVQGGAGTSGTTRNLAMIGLIPTDQLFLNWYGEYTGGTHILGTSGAALSVLANSNVGIGTPSPGFKLHVVESTASPAIYAQTTGAHYAIYARAGPGAGGVVGYSQDSGNYGILGYANSTGVYGYGTGAGGQFISPVNGAYIQGTNYATYSYNSSSGCYELAGYSSYGMYTNCNSYTAGTVYYGGLVSVSDGRLKENVKPLETPLEKVMALRPISYTWKKEADQAKAYPGVHIGFVAQEVKSVFPEVVTESEHVSAPPPPPPVPTGVKAPDGKAMPPLPTPL